MPPPAGEISTALNNTVGDGRLDCATRIDVLSNAATMTEMDTYAQARLAMVRRMVGHTEDQDRARNLGERRLWLRPEVSSP